MSFGNFINGWKGVWFWWFWSPFISIYWNCVSLHISLHETPFWLVNLKFHEVHPSVVRWDHPGLDALSNALTAERNARIEVPWCLWDFHRFRLISRQNQDTWKRIRRSFIISTTSWVPHEMIWYVTFLKCFDLIPSRDPGKVIHPKGQTPTGIPLDRGTGAGGACTRPGPFKLRNPRSKIIKRRISMHIIQHHPTSSRNVLVPTWFYILMYILSDERFKGNLFMKYWLDKSEPGGQLSSPAPRLLSSPIVRPSWDADQWLEHSLGTIFVDHILEGRHISEACQYQYTKKLKWDESDVSTLMYSQFSVLQIIRWYPIILFPGVSLHRTDSAWCSWGKSSTRPWFLAIVQLRVPWRTSSQWSTSPQIGFRQVFGATISGSSTLISLHLHNNHPSFDMVWVCWNLSLVFPIRLEIAIWFEMDVAWDCII